MIAGSATPWTGSQEMHWQIIALRRLRGLVGREKPNARLALVGVDPDRPHHRQPAQSPPPRDAHLALFLPTWFPPGSTSTAYYPGIRHAGE